MIHRKSETKKGRERVKEIERGGLTPYPPPLLSVSSQSEPCGSRFTDCSSVYFPKAATWQSGKSCWGLLHTRALTHTHIHTGQRKGERLLKSILEKVSSTSQCVIFAVTNNK